MSVLPGEEDSHVVVLTAACEELFESLALLGRLAPVLPLTSVFAKDVHTLLYLVGNVETALHQFVDRELLGPEQWNRRREHGARLQDALGRATSAKSTVKASLLAGGIASLLHLFALTLRRLNGQLEALQPLEEAGDAYLEMAAAGACAVLVRRTSHGRAPRVRALATAFGATCAARALLVRARRRRHLHRLHASQERLSLILQLWWLATSVLQRATKHNSSSYIELDKLARDDPSVPAPAARSRRLSGDQFRLSEDSPASSRQVCSLGPPTRDYPPPPTPPLILASNPRLAASAHATTNLGLQPATSRLRPRHH